MRAPGMRAETVWIPTHIHRKKTGADDDINMEYRHAAGDEAARK